ncbi:hypothetical protein LJC23_00300 [Desulfovibrio sp. OttesenSCG-928-I05]|nr:hypothetical protein [Desulfovibrio sp. OttesenSCG-928-I05]
MTNKAAPFVLAVLAVSLLTMFSVSLYQRVQGPGLVLPARHNHPEELAETGNSTQGTAGSGDASSAAWQTPGVLPPEDATALGSLMARIQAAPNDAESLLAIADIFARHQDWDRVEAFLLRAAKAAPSDIRPLHMLGINHTRKGDYPAAAASFEAALERGNNPSVAYSLAILYSRYMHAPDRAIPLLESLLSDSGVPDAVRTLAKEEMQHLQ